MSDPRRLAAYHGTRAVEPDELAPEDRAELVGRALRGDGPPVEVAPSLRVGAPVRLEPQACRNKCGLRTPGKASRAPWEPPSRVGWRGGERVLWCTCCERVLRRAESEDVVDEDGSVGQLRPAGLAADVDAAYTVWSCDTCGYDTRWLTDLRGTGERGRR